MWIKLSKLKQGFWNPREELSEFVYFPKWSVSSVLKVDVLKENKVRENWHF